MKIRKLNKREPGYHSRVQTRNPEQAIVCTDRLMLELGVKTVAELLKVNAEEITDTWARLYGFYQVLGIRTFPERDGKYLPLNHLCR